MRASAFAELDPVEQRARITAVFSSSYIFSLAIVSKASFVFPLHLINILIRELKGRREPSG